jgi:hypothetical protein
LQHFKLLLLAALGALQRLKFLLQRLKLLLLVAQDAPGLNQLLIPFFVHVLLCLELTDGFLLMPPTISHLCLKRSNLSVSFWQKQHR